MTPTDAETTFDASRATHGAATDAETTFDAYSCPYDGAACLLLGPLAAPIGQRVGRDYPAVVETAARVVPCRDCPRYSRVVVDGLAGVRLGKHERRVLLKAAECSKGAVVVPLGEGRSGEEAHRRALRRLQQVRLIRRGQDWHVWLTPQGSTVVAQIGAALRRGQPVRWPRVRAAILAALQTPPETLWQSFRRALDMEERRTTESARIMSELYKMGIGTDKLRTSVYEHLAQARHLQLVLNALDAAGQEAAASGAGPVA